MIYQDWNNSLYPRAVGDPEKILELGFGSGEWAYELAEYDPDCTVGTVAHAGVRNSWLDRCWGWTSAP